MKYKYLAVLVFTILTSTTAAQVPHIEEQKRSPKNLIGVQTGFILNLNQASISPSLNLLGVSYYRQIYENWYCGIDYSSWIGWTKWDEQVISDVQDKSYIDWETGDLHARRSYQMVDVNIAYTPIKFKRNSDLLIGLGLGRYWGVNYYVTSYTFNHLLWGKERKRAYWGVSPQVSYRYSIWNNRLHIAPVIRTRHFINSEIPIELNACIKVEINF